MAANVIPPSPVTSHCTLPTTPLNLIQWRLLTLRAAHSGHIDAAVRDALLHRLHHGFPIGVDPSLPVPTTVRFCRNLPGTLKGSPDYDPIKTLKILKSLQREIQLGRTAGPFISPPFPNLQISPLGAVPKKRSERLRIIHDLSFPHNDKKQSVNSRLIDTTCQYLRFHDVLRRIAAIGPSCLLAKIDIKDAFRLLRVRPEDQYNLGIRFWGFFLYERCIPFGIHPGPSLFEEFATAVEKICNAMGIPDIPHYADDSLLITTPQQAGPLYALALSIFTRLGIPISEDKLIPPSPIVEFLGLVIDCPAGQIRIPEDKLIAYRRDISSARTHPENMSLHDIQSLLGILIYASQCVHKGRLFLSHLLGDLKEALTRGGGTAALQPGRPPPSTHHTHIEATTLRGVILHDPLPPPYLGPLSSDILGDSASEDFPVGSTEGVLSAPPDSIRGAHSTPSGSPVRPPPGSLARHPPLPSPPEPLDGLHRRGPKTNPVRLHLSPGALMELRWWDKCLQEWNGVSIIPPSLALLPLSRRHTLSTDACGTGMGAWLLKADGSAHFLLHRWSDREISLATRKKRISMPFLEMLSVIRSVFTWQNDLADSAIVLRTDCTAVVQGINTNHSKSLLSHQLLLSLFLTTTKNRIFIDCQHIKGILNVEADALSRAPSPTDTHLYPSYLSHEFFSLPSVSSVPSHLLSQTTIVDLPSEHLGPLWSAFATPPWRPPPTKHTTMEFKDS